MTGVKPEHVEVALKSVQFADRLRMQAHTSHIGETAFAAYYDDVDGVTISGVTDRPSYATKQPDGTQDTSRHVDLTEILQDGPGHYREDLLLCIVSHLSPTDQEEPHDQVIDLESFQSSHDTTESVVPTRQEGKVIKEVHGASPGFVFGVMTAIRSAGSEPLKARLLLTRSSLPDPVMISPDYILKERTDVQGTSSEQRTNVGKIIDWMRTSGYNVYGLEQDPNSSIPADIVTEAVRALFKRNAALEQPGPYLSPASFLPNDYHRPPTESFQSRSYRTRL